MTCPYFHVLSKAKRMTDSPNTDPVLTLIVPVFNEEDALPQAYPVLNDLLTGLGRSYEVIVIDNGSYDDTEAIAQDIALKDAHWKYIRLSRNFGYQNSLTAALSMANGQAIVSIDVDLQDPPEMIADFLKKWDEGYDIVYGVRMVRQGESRLKRWATAQALNLISWASDYPLPVKSGDFRLMSRRARDAFLQMPESNRYLRGMVHWVGFKQVGIPYERRPRQFGEQTRGSSNTVFHLINLTLDAIFSFSMKPLRVFLLMGMGITGVSVVLVVVYVLAAIFFNPPRGFTTLLLFGLIQLGITSLGIGVLGEYLGRTYAEVKRRPLWLIAYTLGFEEKSAPTDDT